MMYHQPVGSPATVRNAGLAGLLLFLSLSPPGRAAAVVSLSKGIGAEFIQPPPDIGATFRFEVVDVADNTPGQDLWEYRYTVSDLTLTAGQGFTIFFDLNLYTLLQSPPPSVNADLDLLTVQPDLTLRSNGFYDAQSLRDNPSLAGVFKVRFTWLGSVGTTPGAQPVTVYNADFSTREQSQTTNVPEPSAFALLLTAGSLLAGRWRKVVPGFNPSARTNAG